MERLIHKSEDGHLDPAILAALRATALPGAEVVPSRDPCGTAGDYHWLVPFRGMAGKLALVWALPAEQAYGLSAVAKWPARADASDPWRRLASCYMRGGLAAVPGVHLVRTEASPAHWRRVGWTDSQPPRIAVHLSRRSSDQIAVALLSRRGRPGDGVVCKLPVGIDAPARIVREAAILRRLAEEKPGMAPRSLYHDPAGAFAVEELLAGSCRHVHDSRPYWDFLLRMRLSDEASGGEMAAARLRSRIAAEAASGALAGNDRNMLELAAGIVARGPRWPAVWVHTDLTPSNLLTGPDNALRAIDWPDAIDGGMPFTDHLLATIRNQVLTRDPRPIELPPITAGLKAYARELGVGSGLLATAALAVVAGRFLDCLRSDDGLLGGSRQQVRDLVDRCD